MNLEAGLTSQEANALLQQNGPNSIEEKPARSKTRLLLRQFDSPIILILFAATIVSMFAGEITDGIIILSIIIPSGVLGFWQENRAGKTMQSLMTRVQVHVEVIRDGVEVKIPIGDVVVGDLVSFHIGDVVPADIHLVKAEKLLVDESALTGESYPCEKRVGEIDESKPLTDRSSELFFGSHIVGGNGQGVVVKTGRSTEFGALAKEISSRDVTTRFERGTTAFGILLMQAMLVLLSILFVVNIILHRPLLDSILFSLALAVGLTPQLLPVIISVSLATGAKHLAQEQVLVKRLDAIEDFGLMNVLCTDKTGTITAGVVSLNQALDSSGALSEVVLRLAYLNSKLQRGYENPLDLAIISSAGNKFEQVPLLDEIPYDFERRRLSILVADRIPMLITKGAFESTFGICSQVRSRGQLLDIANMRTQLFEKFEELSSQGNRVLAVATKAIQAGKIISPSDEAEMVFEGLLVFQDPLKPDAIQAITELKKLGVDLHLVTGDNRLVARSIASQVGLAAGVLLTGSDLAGMSDEVLASKVRDCRVFAEVDPIQKARIILALRAGGATVGYFGDGINDAAALHAADVGISVDTAVDVAKNAASVVLLSKDLHVIAEGVRLGRRTFVNTMKYVRVGVSASFGNVLSMAVADVFLPFLPLLPTQILLLNFLTDFPAVSISADSVDPETVEQPRTWDIKSIRRFMVFFGLLSSAFDIMTFLILRLGFHASVTEFRSGWFVESTLTELTVMLVLRTSRPFWRSRPGKGLLISSILLALLTVMLPFTPIGRVIGLTALSMPILLILFGLICVYAAINEIAKRYWMH
ncbi:MAG: magnesium-translocating P-type ATPase [Candidatus Nanopelagicaceae bacterium]|nr:magnesium-translocating P-type ATPase [Candidatus Nanopelagicaceae bacterium]